MSSWRAGLTRRCVRRRSSGLSLLRGRRSWNMSSWRAGLTRRCVRRRSSRLNLSLKQFVLGKSCLIPPSSKTVSMLAQVALLRRSLKLWSQWHPKTNLRPLALSKPKPKFWRFSLTSARNVKTLLVVPVTEKSIFRFARKSRVMATEAVSQLTVRLRLQLKYENAPTTAGLGISHLVLP